MDQNAFDNDIGQLDGYAYTQLNCLSAAMANARMSKALHRHLDCKGKTLIDIGCGDGAYTYEFVAKGAASILGIDPVASAVESAAEKYKNIPNLKFNCHDISTMPLPERKYDIAVLRGVLHHMHNMKDGIRAACRMGKEVVVVEPNGYNLVLKIIEKTSAYHIAHKEQSFLPGTLREQFRENGGVLIHGNYVGLVPCFCPNALAKFLKVLEPLVEAIPVVKQIACGQYIMHVRVT
jgi:ubiquinone/menaquinone biosynthesis C-methylase UbiE